MNPLPKIGITIGDINGIGLEVILKVIADKRLLSLCDIIIYGSAKSLAFHKALLPEIGEIPVNTIKTVDLAQTDIINIVNLWGDANIELGTISEEAGKYAILALEQATEDLKMGYIDGLVTAPIHKKAMQLAGFQYIGHTEYLADKLSAPEHLMMMVNEELRVALATNHLPIQAVAQQLSKEKIQKKIQLFNESLRTDFGINKPKIAVLGLNPHAGDDGTIGKEELEMINPAIVEAKKMGILVVGAYAADGFWGTGQYKSFDGILAMYHDQGLIPFKLLSFESGVNYTAGLPCVRTSPDHGTAFNIVGQDLASPDSMMKAIFVALDIIRQRAEYLDMHSRPLRPLHVDEKLFDVDEKL
jgi:4-phospho-D-threonate 3-dehydrogenase / 4-phospho-D-erythronate 3-dehydrogenase